MNIGQVADLLGIHVQTIRYYEREGLLPPLARTPRGYRTLDATTIRRIRFIRHAQEAGFTLREIADLLALQAAPDGTCHDVLDFLQDKLADLEQRITQLHALQQVLKNLAARCVTGLPANDCPVLEALEHDAFITP